MYADAWLQLAWGADASEGGREVEQGSIRLPVDDWLRVMLDRQGLAVRLQYDECSWMLQFFTPAELEGFVAAVQVGIGWGWGRQGGYLA